MPKDGYATDIGVGGTRTATASPALSRSATGRSGVPSARVIGTDGTLRDPRVQTETLPATGPP
jgi:hypothetical protein